jgi:hypothetical protein
MKGFEIFYRDRAINVVPECCDITVFIYNRNGHYYIQVSGMDKKLMAYTWIDSWLGQDFEMEIGEAVEIEIKDIDKSSEPVSKKIAFSNPVNGTGKEIEAINAERIERFYALEKILNEEGLI